MLDGKSTSLDGKQPFDAIKRHPSSAYEDHPQNGGTRYPSVTGSGSNTAGGRSRTGPSEEIQAACRWVGLGFLGGLG